jgi:hypothetical protein
MLQNVTALVQRESSVSFARRNAMRCRLIRGITVVAIAGAAIYGSSPSSARDVATCGSRQYALTVRGNAVPGGSLAVVRLRHIRGSACRLNGTLRVAVRGADGAIVSSVTGNPATLRLGAGLKRRATIVRHVLWQNWCGDGNVFAFGARFRGAQTDMPTVPPRCLAEASTSTLEPLGGWGQPQPLLGAAPADCGPVPPQSRPNAAYPLGFGAEPFWFFPYAAFDATLPAIRVPAGAPHTGHGWQIKTLWVVAQHLDAPVHLQVGGLRGGTRMWVELSGSHSFRESFILDPAHPGAYHDPDMADFPSYAYFAKAGCYVVEANWPGGATSIVLGVGR